MAKSIFQKLGSRGGQARAARLTAAQRSASARHASLIRWGKASPPPDDGVKLEPICRYTDSDDGKIRTATVTCSKCQDEVYRARFRRPDHTPFPADKANAPILAWAQHVLTMHRWFFLKAFNEASGDEGI